MAPRKKESAENVGDSSPSQNIDSTNHTDQTRQSGMHPPDVPPGGKLSGSRSRTTGKSNRTKASGQNTKKGNGSANATARVTAGRSNPRSGLLAKFVIHDQNNLMDDDYSEGKTPFDDSGELPQRKVDAMQSKKKGLKWPESEELNAVSSSSLPLVGLETQELLNSTLSSQDTARALFQLRRDSSRRMSEATEPELPVRAATYRPPTEPAMANEQPMTISSVSAARSSEQVGPELEDQEPGIMVPSSNLYRSPSPRNQAFFAAHKGKSIIRRSETLADSPRRTSTMSAGLDRVPQAISYSRSEAFEPFSSTQESEIYKPKMVFNYGKFFDDGLTALTALAYKQATQRRWTIATQMSEEDWRALAVPLLCSINSKDLAQLVSGKLVFTARNEEQQRSWTENGSKEAPVVYARGFANTQTGQSLTAGELRRVLLRLRLYITSDLTEDKPVELVKAVDDAGTRNGGAIKARHVKEGRRHFFGDNWLDVEAHRRREIVGIFYQQCEEHIDGFPPDRPVRTFYYVGYALIFAACMNDHRSPKGRSSWFMNLFLAACKAELPESDETTWGFVDIALCYCAEYKEVPVAEVLLTLLARAWYSDGVGFGTQPPGLRVSSSSLNSRTMEAARQLWTECEDFRKNQTPFQQNLEHELLQIEAYPFKHQQRISAAASRIPDILEQARIIDERVTRKRKAMRNEMASEIQKAREGAATLKHLVHDPSMLDGLEADNANLLASLDALGKEDDHSINDESMLPSDNESQSADFMEIESELPNMAYYDNTSQRDVPMESTELGGPSGGPGPSNWYQR